MSKKKGSALKKPVKISTALAAVIGKGPMPRTDVTKKIWAYIKKKKLQVPGNARFIKLDATLKTILKPSKTAKMGSKTLKVPAGSIFMMDMTKQLNKHIASANVKVNPSSRYEEEEEEEIDDYGYDDDGDDDDYDDDDQDDDYYDEDEEEEEEEEDDDEW